MLCGPPHSGKSCLREGLKQAIKAIPDAPYPYVITACPDGEGAWFSDAVKNDPVLARQLKDDYKSKFTPEFAAVRAEWVRNATTPLTIIDVGGKASPENRMIMSGATHAVILAGDKEKIPGWREFCTELNLKIIGEIYSDYTATEDTVEETDGLLLGSVHHLERGENNEDKPMVKVLANLLVQMVQGPKKGKPD